ncbi:hypothetical protein [Novipirellula caenicola]|uniref:Uncharacterized protein n=1 Tax=Novipirellula caenicola TaxID=1536901 RepID=A0ABP9VRY0_9BACT
MPQLTVHWRHEGFSHDAGQRSNEDISGTNVDSVHTGVLTDEHQEVTDGRPVLVEDETSRVYRAADLPPDTQVVVAKVTQPLEPMLEKARRAGFEVVTAG